jgi:hypothetical protein
MPTYRGDVGTLWWKTVDAFVADVAHADDDRLITMCDWASEHELSANAPGLGRNPKARRHFRQMRDAAEKELARRGLLAVDPAQGAADAPDDDADVVATARGKTRIMYIESKADGVTGPARIGRVTFSKRGSTIYYQGRAYQSLKGAGFKANYYDVETGEHFWISGPKKNGDDRLYGEAVPVEIDEDAREEYWRDIRGLPERISRTIANH